MRHISEVIGLPVIGKMYWVPCVMAPGIKSEADNIHTRAPVWLPIIGPPHNDADFLGVSAAHYHFDVRFFSERLVRLLAADQRNAAAVLRRVAGVEGILKGPINRRLKCRRQMPEYPLETQRCDGGVEGFAQLPEFERAYSKYRVACGRCPHRNFPLHGLPDNNGVVVCPGHGLAWNLLTGEMVSRVKR